MKKKTCSALLIDHGNLAGCEPFTIQNSQIKQEGDLLKAILSKKHCSTGNKSLYALEETAIPMGLLLLLSSRE